MNKLVFVYIFTTIIFGCAHAPNSNFPSDDEMSNISYGESLWRIIPNKDANLSIEKCYQGNYQEGLKQLKALDTKDLNSAQLNLIATCYLLNDELILADFYFNLAYSSSPQSPEILNNYSILKTKTHDYMIAEKMLRQVVDQNPTLGVPKYNLSLLLIQTGRIALADKLVRENLKRSPKDPLLLQQKGLIEFYRGNFKQSLSYLQKVPISSWISTELGLIFLQVLIENNQKAEAKKLWKIIDGPIRKSALARQIEKTLEDN